MKLEDFRENDIGTTSIWIPSLGKGPESLAHLTYMQFSHLAFYYTAEQIEQLELSKDQINQGNAVIASTGLWFMTIEAYINSLLRVVCLVKNLSFDELKKRDFGPRIKALFDLLEIDRTPFYNGPFQRLEEFKTYRNELFHDRTNDQPLKFNRTIFNGNPFYANQVDVMQAAVIAVEVCHAFRQVIPKLDLMPQIMIRKDDSFFYEKLDVLYAKLLSPYFEQSLSKHNLESLLETNILSAQLEESKIFSETSVEVLIKVTPEEKYRFSPNTKETHIGKNLIQNVRDSINFDTKSSFKIANFNR